MLSTFGVFSFGLVASVFSFSTEFFMLAVVALLLLYGASLAVYSLSPTVSFALASTCVALICGYVGIWIGVLVAFLLGFTLMFSGVRIEGFGMMGIALYVTPVVAIACALYGAHQTWKRLIAQQRLRGQ